MLRPMWPRLLPHSGRARRLKAGHSSSSHLDGFWCCWNTLPHLLHRIKEGGE